MERRILSKFLLLFVALFVVFACLPVSATSGGGDTTDPEMTSLVATIEGTDITSTNGTITCILGDEVTSIRVTMDEPVSLVGTPNVTIEGGTIPEGTVYGTISLDTSDTTNKTLIITPNPGNEEAGQLGAFTFSVADEVIEDSFGNSQPYTFTLQVAESLVRAVGDGVTPMAETTLDSTQAFTFSFASANSNLDELQLDIYFGVEAGESNRVYANCVQINLPANATGVEGLIDAIDDAFYEHTRSELVAAYGENEIRMYEAVGFCVGQHKATAVKEKVKYEGTATAGTWTITMNTYLLREDALELLVMVTDDKDAEWGQNNYTINGGADTKAFYYTLLAPSNIYVDDDYDGDSYGNIIGDGIYVYGANAFATIQDAVDNVREGGTVYVAAGSYDSFLVDGKSNVESVSIIGEDADTTIIDGQDGAADVEMSGLSAVAGFFGCSDVTFSGFTVKNSATDPTTSAGIGVAFSSRVLLQNNIAEDNASGIVLYATQDSTVTNNTFTDNAAYGIWLEGYSVDECYSTGNTLSENAITDNTIDGIYCGVLCDDNMISDNTISGSTQLNGVNSSAGQDANGIYLWKSGGNTVTGNTLSGNTGSGIELMGANQNSINGNVITDNDRNGVWIRYSPEYPDTGLNAINDNKIYGNDTDGDGYQLCTLAGFSAIDAEYNWWGTAVATAVAAGIYDADVDAVDYIPFYTNANMTALSGEEIYVDDDYTSVACGGHIWGVDAFDNIQDAIDAAAVGGTINVAAGKYVENIFIDKEIYLFGATDGVSTIDGAGSGIVVSIIADDVTFSGFNVVNSGADPITCSGIGLADISGCTIENNTLSGNANGIVITASAAGDADCENNIIRNNTITNCAAYGIALVGYYTYSPLQATVHSVNNTMIRGNDISGCGGADGIYVDMDCNGNTIRENSIVGVDTTGTKNGIYLWTSSDNTVIGNTITNNAYGIQLRCSSNNTFNGNTVTGNGIGFYLRSSDVEAIIEAYPASPNYFNNNNIYGNINYGIQTHYSISRISNGDTLDATGNWWGSDQPEFDTLINEERSDDVVDYGSHSTTYIYEVEFVSDASSVENPDSVWVAAGKALGDLPTLTRTGYNFGGWYTEENGGGTRYLATSLMPAYSLTLYADWNKKTSGGSTVTTTPETSDAFIVTTTDQGTTISGTLTNTDNGLTVNMPGDVFDEVADSTDASVIVETDMGIVTFDAVATDYISAASATGDVSLTIEAVDVATLTADVQAAIGDRPVYDFTLMADDELISNLGGGSVSISIPYTLQNGENPNAIVVYYIDESGNLNMIEGYYNSAIGTVDFTLDHLSVYGVGYNQVTFSDVAKTAWYYDAVTFIAAREITSGMGNNMYGPENTLTRGQFVVMLMNAYGIEPQDALTNNFSDAGDTYYTDYLATAKKLGIANGIGNNMFAPDANISRQEMFTLLYRALDKLGQLPEATSTNTLDSFSDAADISAYAQDAFASLVASGVISGSNGQLNPQELSTRAQMAQILKNLLTL